VHFNAKVLIMDEPTAALGPHEKILVKELITRLKDEGVGILLISHDIQDVFDVADRLVVMAEGRVVGQLHTRDATKDEILAMIILGGQPAASEEGAAIVDATLDELAVSQIDSSRQWSRPREKR
jgi:D-xylose transport system ATP-binding protein